MRQTSEWFNPSLFFSFKTSFEIVAKVAYFVVYICDKGHRLKNVQ